VKNEAMGIPARVDNRRYASYFYPFVIAVVYFPGLLLSVTEFCLLVSGFCLMRRSSDASRSRMRTNPVTGKLEPATPGREPRSEGTETAQGVGSNGAVKERKEFLSGRRERLDLETPPLQIVLPDDVLAPLGNSRGMLFVCF
jgi:hypothetical protein